jgi:3D (Asp-Asp-Asp) domain-containing protein
MMRIYCIFLAVALLTGVSRGAVVTSYCDRGIMADGHRVHVGACAGPRWIPLGTVVLIGGKRYIVEDRTALRFNGRWDVWVTSKKSAIAWGKRSMRVKVL